MHVRYYGSSAVRAPARARIATHLRWTCGQFAVEGVVSDGVEQVMAMIRLRLTLVRAIYNVKTWVEYELEEVITLLSDG